MGPLRLKLHDFFVDSPAEELRRLASARQDAAVLYHLCDQDCLDVLRMAGQRRACFAWMAVLFGTTIAATGLPRQLFYVMVLALLGWRCWVLTRRINLVMNRRPS